MQNCECASQVLSEKKGKTPFKKWFLCQNESLISAIDEIRFLCVTHFQILDLIQFLFKLITKSGFLIEIKLNIRELNAVKRMKN